MTITREPRIAVQADPTAGFRRRAAAIALPLAFVCQLVCNSLYAWTSTSSGLSDQGGAAEAQRFFAAFPGEMLVATMFALIGVLLAVPGLLAALRVIRPAKPRLGLWAVVLMITGYVCYFGIVFTNFDALALAVAGTDVGALDTSPMAAAAMAFFLLFVIGNLIGTLLLGLAVMLGGRRAGVPWWAGLLIMGWTIGHVINIVGAGEWFAVAGGALEVVGLAILAAAALRLSDADWIRRG